MKILIIHNHYQFPGGEDTAVRSEIQMLQGFGHDVQVYQRSNREIDSYDFFKKGCCLSFDMAWSQGSYTEIRNVLRDKRPDLAHVHNTFFMISPSVYTACKEEKVPVVQTLHNYRWLCANGVFYRQGGVCEDCLSKGRASAVHHSCWRDSKMLSAAVVHMQHKFWHEKFYRDITAFIALSEFSKKKIIQGGFPKDKMHVKPNFLEADPGVRGKPGAYVLYAGALRDYKGIGTLVKAWQGLRGIPLKVAGAGPLWEEVQASRHPDIEYLGEKSPGEIIGLIKNSAFVVLPSECYENFPRVLVEAAACGVPVVASDLGALRELVENGRTGLLFKPGDPGDLAAKVSDLFSNPKLISEMGSNARKKFETEWSLEKNYQRLMEIYEKAQGFRAQGTGNRVQGTGPNYNRILSSPN